MRRWRWFILLGMLVLGFCFGLSVTVIDPGNYTGIWYYAEDGSQYLFHNGIILSEKHHIDILEEEIISGAYQFGKKEIFLFFLNEDGVQDPRTLALVSSATGDLLCDIASGEPVFFRNKAADRSKE